MFEGFGGLNKFVLSRRNLRQKLITKDEVQIQNEMKITIALGFALLFLTEILGPFQFASVSAELQRALLAFA